MFKNTIVRNSLIMLTALYIGYTLMAGVECMPVSAYCDNTPNVMLPAPGLPKLAADVTIIGQVSYCKNFNLNITIINHGNELADDVNLFLSSFREAFSRLSISTMLTHQSTGIL